MGREEQWEGWMLTLFNCRLTAEWKGRKHPFWKNQWTEDNPQVTTFMEASQENKRDQRNGCPLQQLKGDRAQASIRQTGRLRPRVGPGLTWGPMCVPGSTLYKGVSSPRWPIHSGGWALVFLVLHSPAFQTVWSGPQYQGCQLSLAQKTGSSLCFWLLGSPAHPTPTLTC